MTLVAPTLQAFFTDRLTRQLQASPRTIASYRDTLRLLLVYVHDTTGKQPSALDWEYLDEPLITAFLEHREHEGHNSIRSQQSALTAIRSLRMDKGSLRPASLVAGGLLLAGASGSRDSAAVTAGTRARVPIQRSSAPCP